MRNLITTVLFMAALLAAPAVCAQDFPDPDKSPMDQVAFPASYKESNKVAKITYSRPQLKGRSLSKLAPEGKVWRLGANEAVELTTYANLKIGGKEVRPGTYTMYAIPNSNTWTFIISKDLNVWGAYFYNEKSDVARFDVPVTKGEDAVEYFSMKFEETDGGAKLLVGWDHARLEVPFLKM